MYNNKKILVCGMARSGISVSKLLHSNGAIVSIYDKKEINNEELKNLKINIISTESPLELVKNFDILVVSPGLPLTLDFIQEAYKLSIPVVSEIEISSTLTNKTIIGITGTNGKTTCTTLINEIFSANGFDSYAVGNIGLPFSEKIKDEKDNTVYVTELSSYQLESTFTLKPKVGVVINLSVDHIERHKTYENYIDAKKRIFQNSDESDFLVLNYDDEICRNMANETNAQIVFFSQKTKLDKGLYVENKKVYYRKELILNLEKVLIPGAHNVENILACLCVAISLKLDLDKVCNVIYNFSGVEHRIEYVCRKNNIDYINDSKSTNENSAINAIKAFENKKVTLVLGGYGTNCISDELAELIIKNISKVILIGESKFAIKEVFDNLNFKNYFIAENLKEVIKISKNICEKEETLLFSPGYKSFDMFNDFEDRGRQFKEAVID